MGLHGKLVAAMEFQPGGDLYHEIVTQKPHHISTASPEKVQGCDLLEGERGKEGSIICWRYTHDGKEKTAKQVIQLIDDENKKIEFKMLEGDLMEEYKDFLITIHVETKNGKELVTWTLEYESISEEEATHPISMLAYFIELTKDMESHHLIK